MRLFAIGDLHLPGGPRGKGMEVFGAAWRDHAARVAAAWGELARPEDVLLITGDLSWAMNLDEARADLAWIEALPGRKVIIRGNHDFWWSGIGKVRGALGPSVVALQHDHVLIEGTAIVGTRGWQCPGSLGSADLMAGAPPAAAAAYSESDRRIYLREVERLRLGLEALKRRGARHERLVVALHYPPMNPEHQESGFTRLLDEFGADLCVHGHLHGAAAHATAFEGRRMRTEYRCVSADRVDMRPLLVLEA